MFRNDALEALLDETCVYDAPTACSEITSLLSASKVKNWQAQFWNADIQFTPSSDTSVLRTEDIKKFLDFSRGAFAKLSDVVGLSEDNLFLLHNVAVIVPDTRSVHSTAKTDPIVAGVHRLSSMLVSVVKVCPADPAYPHGEKVLYLKTVLNHLHESEGEIVTPGLIPVTLNDLKRSLVAFSCFRNALEGLDFPDDTVFMIKNANGLPVSPITLSTLSSEATDQLSQSADIAAADQKIRRDASIKQATKDHLFLANIKGMFDDVLYAKLFGAEFPTLTGASASVRSLVMGVVYGVAIPDATADKILSGQFLSSSGLNSSPMISITLFAAKDSRPVSNHLHFNVMIQNLITCFEAIYGAVAGHCLAILAARLTLHVFPTDASNEASSTINRGGAIDLINYVLHSVNNDPDLRLLSGKNRWMTPIDDIESSQVFHHAVVQQRNAGVVSMIEKAKEGRNGSGNNGGRGGSGRGNGGRGGGRGGRGGSPNQRSGRGNGGRGNGKSSFHTDDDDEPPSKSARVDSKRVTFSHTEPPPPSSDDDNSTLRCNKQDNPDGCPYGLLCRFVHDADKPKVAKRRGRGTRG
jgi:hypothetical protein